MKNEIILYQSDELVSHIEVRIEDETVWLSQVQMMELFQTTKQNISLHINNIFKEGELLKEATVKDYLIVQTEGEREVQRKISLYNLDVIISVGYRVKSKQGTQFRIWANKIIKDYLLKGYALNNRMNRVENDLEQLSEKVDEIDLQIKTNLPPNQGIFFDGQIFDAYIFVNKLLRSAKKDIVLIDNYIDDTVLTLFSKYPKLKFTVITSKISKQLNLDIEKYNQQYSNLKIEISKKYHDRFLIIDRQQTYHIGASLKDLGKKIFAFSKLEINILGKI